MGLNNIESIMPEIPKVIFIVPYRDRKEHQEIFSSHMKNILKDYTNDEYEIIYVHQMDERKFNRGAMKNIGFLYVKEKYPETYKDITLVFNDVDTMPKQKKDINYETVKGVVKHFYGFEFTLGGIVSIKASDFELIHGFPNFWTWGYEDNTLQQRVKAKSLRIDRSVFYPIGSKEFVHMKDEQIKPVNKEEYLLYRKKTNEGYNNIHNLDYYMTDEGFLNVTSFETGREENKKATKNHNLNTGNKPFNKRNSTMSMIFS